MAVLDPTGVASFTDLLTCRRFIPVESQTFTISGRRPIKHAHDMFRAGLSSLLAPLAAFSQTPLETDLSAARKDGLSEPPIDVPNTI